MNQFRNRTELSLTAKPKSNQRIEETETGIGTEKQQKREMKRDFCKWTLLKLTKDIWNFPLNLRLGNRIKDDSRKGAKDAKFGESSKIFLFAGLASWRDKLC